MAKSKRRPQAPKGGGNLAMRDAFQQLRQGSRTSPHRDRSKFSRNDERRARQNGWS